MHAMHVCAHSAQPAQRMRRRAVRGTTMIEALVAILILSIGMLGIAGLQVASMKYSQGGWARAAVASGLSDFADRIRANPGSAIAAYVLADDYAAQRTALLAKTVVAGKDCEAKTAVCSAAELANFHLVQWRLSIDDSMPGSAALVTGDRAAGYNATVLWFDKSFLMRDGVSLDASATCVANATGTAARNCCPAAANAPDGVRCTNMVVVP